MKTLTLRHAVEEDIPFLLDLRRQTMSGHLVASGVVSAEAEYLARVRAQYECAQVIMQGNQPVGLLKVSREGLNWEIIQVQLIPSLQGQGFGQEIIQSLVSETRREGASLRLSVLKANPARRLYERLGFTVVLEKAHAFEMLSTQNSDA